MSYFYQAFIRGVQRRLQKERLRRRNHMDRSLNVNGELFEDRVMLAANPIDTQFVVNETSSLAESKPAIAVIESTGDFVAAWTSFEQLGGDGSGLGVYAQRFLADGTPNGPAFLVNTIETAGDQFSPAVAVDSSGNFIVVWESQDQDGDGAGVYAQRYLADGTANGSTFKVNEFTAGDQSRPTVAMDNTGAFVIAWQSFGQDGDGLGVYARRFASNGTPQEMNEFLVNTLTTTGDQFAPTASMSRTTGDFVIAFNGEVTAAETSIEVLAHLYQADGTTIREEFQVNTTVPRDQVSPNVAMATTGEFVVAWTLEGQAGSGSDINAQRFDAAGMPAGGEFRVNVTTLQGQVNPAVGIDDDGDFMISWQSSHQDEFSWGIFGRAYASAGDPLTSEFQVNTFAEQPQTLPATSVNTSGEAVTVWLGLDATHTPAVHAQRYQLPNMSQDFAAVGGEVVLNQYSALEEAWAAAAVDANRNFVVVWQSYGDDGSGLGIRGRRLDANGDPLGPAFDVNTFIDGNQSNPDVASDAAGNFVVVWESADQDSSGHGIYAQRFDSTGAKAGPEFQVTTVTAGDQSDPTVAMNPDDGSFVVAWEGPDADLTGIYAQRFDANGNPVGGEFAVNNFTDTEQVSPAASMNENGQFAITWVSDHRVLFDPTDSEKSIFVQWYDSSGVATGDEALAHTIDPAAEAQEYPDIALDASGNFVLAWQSITQDGSAWGVYARQFLANKTPVQPAEFLVNQTTEENQRHVSVVSDPDGNFTISWQSDLQDQSATAIISRQYNADGTPETDESLVNTWELGPQTLPVMAMTPAGDFGVFWIGQGTSRIEGIHGRIYEEGFVIPPPHVSITPTGDQFLVHEAAGLVQSAPAVAVIESTGDYVATWTSFEQIGGDESGLGIYAQRFFADGTPNGDAFLVNTMVTDDDQTAPAIAVDAAGNFVVVWQSLYEDGSGLGIYAQRYQADATPIGSHFQVSVETVGDQSDPAVAMDDAGNFVITWQSADQDGDAAGIFARRYDAMGVAQDMAEFGVTTTTTGNQVAPTIAMSRSTGRFLIAWQTEVFPAEPDPEPTVEIYGRVFNADGSEAVAEAQLNSISDHDQVEPHAAMNSSGDFVVTWTTEGQVGSGADVYARRFNSMGTGQGDDFLVNVTTKQGQEAPVVAMDDDGNFQVAWQSSHQDGFSWGIFAQVYSPTGMVLVNEFQVNSNTQGPQTLPAVSSNTDGSTTVLWLGLDATHHPAVHAQSYQLPTGTAEFEVGPEGEVVLANYSTIEEAPASTGVDGDGNYVVVWESYGDDGSGMGVFARRFDSSGMPLGDRFQVNETTAGNQGRPEVAVDAAGNFIVVWQAAAQDGDGYGVFARRYDAMENPLTSEFQVNTSTTGSQGNPTVAVDTDSGEFVVIWQGPDASGLGVYGQRYDADGNAVGGEFALNTFTDLDQVSPTISMNSSGQFVVGWVSDHRAVFDPNDTEKSIFVRWYDQDGVPSGPETLIHDIVAGLDAQEFPDLAIDESGNFVAVWQSINQDGNTWGVFGRQFLADLTPVQEEFQINQTIIAPQRHASVTLDGMGNFVVAWQAHAQDTSGPGVFARLYDSAAVAQSDEFLVPTWDQGPQTNPVMATSSEGLVGIFWTGHGTDRVEGVHGRIFEIIPTILTVTVDPLSISENGGISKGTVTRSANTMADLVVMLTSSDTTEATVPMTVTIPAGKSSVTFDILAVDDIFVDGDKVVTITASAVGPESASATVTIADDEVLPPTGDDILLFDETANRFKLGTNSGSAFSWTQTNPLSADLAFVGDFDGDGDMDGAFIDWSTHYVSLVRNNGDGTLAMPVLRGSIATSAAADHFHVIDIDGDGTDELIYQYVSDDPNIPGNTLGQIWAKSLLPGGAQDYKIRAAVGYEAFTVADFNDDGREDMVGLYEGLDTDLTTPVTHIIPFYSVVGGNNLTAVLSSGHFGTVGLSNLTSADLNADGRADIAVRTMTGQVLHATTTGAVRPHVSDVHNFVASSRATTVDGLPSFQFGVFNDDLLPDLFVGNPATGELLVSTTSLNSLYVNPVVIHHPLEQFGAGATGLQYVIGDFNGDGYDDIVGLNSNAFVFLSTGDGNSFGSALDFGPIIGGGVG
ncbi:MAG: VCBS repeat-containing protein [Planctomycetaceae bacterium]|nr:VCBS repeat-containing protein [Planctomycetaceae bacterium]